jgi:hypothetical protein
LPLRRAPRGIAVDGTNVYWDDSGTKTLVYVPKGGGTASPVPGVPSVGLNAELTLRGSVLYVSQLSTPILAVSLPNGPATTVTASMGDAPLAAGGNFLYEIQGTYYIWWGDITNQQNGFLHNANVALVGLGADSCAVYALDYLGPLVMAIHPGDTSFYAPAPVAPWGSGQPSTPRIVVDATHVYWGDSAQIYRALKPQ